MTPPTCHTCTHRGVIERRPCYHPDVDEPGFRRRKVRECHVAERPIDRVIHDGGYRPLMPGLRYVD